MNDAALTAERILATAAGGLRRYGPSKATVVDVARALGVSHGSVYRHFPSKSALRDAVAERWLGRISAPLRRISEEKGPAVPRLRRWVDYLVATKRKKALDEPELFATYVALVAGAREVVAARAAPPPGRVERLLADGVARGEIDLRDPAAPARAFFDATGRFHNPAHASEWADPSIDEALENVWDLLVAGLGGKAGRGATSGPRRRRRPR